jgi:hypothetical protein
MPFGAAAPIGAVLREFPLHKGFPQCTVTFVLLSVVI